MLTSLRFSLAVLVLASAPALWAGAAAQDNKPQAAAPAQAEPPAKNAYVGSETCAGCHEDKVPKNLQFHKVLETNKRYGRVGQTCEACHGMGKDHAESADITKIVSFKNLSPTRVNQTCLGCHAQATRASGKAMDPHSRNEMSCTSCHVIHAPKAEPLLVKTSAVALCTSCHTNVRAEFARPYRHKLQEGMVTCIDCHNPHGTTRNAALKFQGVNEPGCLKCHGDKRGPFVYEHAPVQLQGCATCHEPHGSVNPRMLKRAEVRFLCLECHTLNRTNLGGPATAFHDISTPRFQNCTACHVKVHGSNVNRDLTR